MSDSDLPQRFIALDEEGFVLNGDLRVSQEELGFEVLSKLKETSNGSYVSTFGDAPVIVETFNEPFVARHVEIDGDSLSLIMPYDFVVDADMTTLTVDEWDRFHGWTVTGLPFVLGRSAQADLFALCDEFDDDSITLNGKQIPVPPWGSGDTEASKASMWNDVYLRPEKPRFDSGGAASLPLEDMLRRIKPNKCRILVVGSGRGHDAAFFAREGHVVTAMDFSEEALRQGKELYPNLTNIKWVQADLFKTDSSFDAAFDIVFENTLYCAIDPLRRPELVKRYSRWLAEGGHLMGNFFVTSTRTGPPFGATEWELRERLQKNFRFIFWGRWRKSLPGRQGLELFVYAQKLSGN